MMRTQEEKAQLFASLHNREQPLVLPNPWDAGTAILLQGLGFEALATTSAGLAFTLGRKDAGGIARDEVLGNLRAIVTATSLPISADLENGYFHDPRNAAETLRLAAEAGAVGGSLEDASGDPSNPIYDFNHAVERVAAGAAVAGSLPFPFTFTARAENYLYGRPDLDDTIRRLQAFEQAGADVLYAPALPDLEAIKLVCASVKKPVNILLGARHTYSVKQLADVGVRRMSTGSGLNRVALGSFLKASRELKEAGTCAFVEEAIPYAQIMQLMPDAI